MDYGLYVDIFVAIVVLGSVLISFLRGLIREVLTIFGIGGGFVAAYTTGPLLAPLVRDWMGVVEEEGKEPEKFMGALPMPLLADGLAYLSIFVIVVIILSVASHFLAEFVKNVGLGALDRTLGIFFGFARAVVVLGLLYLPFYYLPGEDQKKEWFESSKTHLYLEASSRWINGFMPQDLGEKMEDGVEKVEKATDAQRKLEEMGILGSEAAAEISKEAEKAMDGYDEEFRGGMDDLIEENIDTSPSFNE